MLAALFNEEPKKATPEVLEMWRKMGPFDIKVLVKSGIIELSPEFEIF